MLETFHQEIDQKLSFTRQQSSDFAKKVANDFNVIHDVDARRFCVPGDLLFAMILNKKGLSQNMTFNFSGMVNDGIALELREMEDGHLSVRGEGDKEYLNVEIAGDVSHDKAMIEQLICSYVAFSGMNFPHLLVPLMEQKNVMFNPARPLVIYESMSLSLDTLDMQKPTVELVSSNLEVVGKRGNVTLNFCFKEKGQIVGLGKKRMIMSNLRCYEQSIVDQMITDYNERKQLFSA